jgi:hypothetical protein
VEKQNILVVKAYYITKPIHTALLALPCFNKAQSSLRNNALKSRTVLENPRLIKALQNEILKIQNVGIYKNIPWYTLVFPYSKLFCRLQDEYFISFLLPATIS